MAKFLTISAVLSSFSASFAFATAVPGTFLPVHPEVIPGPGLPSLASLGITSDDLYKRELVIDSVNGLSKRFDNFCGGGRGATGNVDDVIACFDYLNRLGTTRCGVPGDNNQHIFCTAGTASVNGVSLINRETGSYCSDVAAGVQWIFTNCNNGGQVEGSAAANGNGDLIVVVGQKDR